MFSSFYTNVLWSEFVLVTVKSDEVYGHYVIIRVIGFRAVELRYYTPKLYPEVILQPSLHHLLPSQKLLLNFAIVGSLFKPPLNGQIAR